MRTLFLHVGPHKTGTTAIQKFMLDNHDLLFKHGLVYPKRYLKIFGHHAFRDKITERSFSEEDASFFELQTHNFILSSEDFISLSKDDFDYVKDVFSNFEIKVIYSWRRASKKLYSIWQEVIKHGGTQDFYSYYHEHLARPGTSQMLSPDLKVGTFVQVFGKGNVIVLDYESSSQSKRLLKDFLAITQTPENLDFFEQSDANAVNKSMPLIDTEIVRGLNHIMASRYNMTGASARLAFQKFRASLDKSKLDSLSHIINGYCRELKVGNYFIDVRAEQVMTNRFESNIFNYQANNDVSSIVIASAEWTLDRQATSIIDDFADTLHQLLSGESGE